VVYVGGRGKLEGYLYYEVDADAGPFKLSVTLTEFIAATPAAHRGLAGHLASLADQVAEILHLAPGDNGWLALMKTSQNLRPTLEMSVYHDTGNAANGLMLRLTDVRAALERLPVAPEARGEFALALEDRVLAQSARAFRVRAEGGRLRVGATTARGLPRLSAAPDALASIVGGALSPVRAAEIGLVDSAGGAAERIEDWFRARPAFVHPLNAF